MSIINIVKTAQDGTVFVAKVSADFQGRVIIYQNGEIVKGYHFDHEGDYYFAIREGTAYANEFIDTAIAYRNRFSDC